MLSEDPSGHPACLRSNTALEMPQLYPSPKPGQAQLLCFKYWDLKHSSKRLTASHGLSPLCRYHILSQDLG